MASLYIKDDETAAIATRVSRLMSASKTATVRRALLDLEAKLEAESAKPRQSTVEWLRAYRERHPLPPPTGLKADKAFFDEMWGEDAD